MLVRIRWFLLGVLATVGGGMVAVGRIARRRSSRAAAARVAADLLDRLAGSVRGDAA